MRKSILTLASAAYVFLAATSAHAEADANWFLQKIDEGDKTALFALDAYENGIGWANADLEQSGRRLYCPPGKIALTPDQTADILRRYVKEYPTLGGAPAGAALLMALKYTFPCPNK